MNQAKDTVTMDKAAKIMDGSNEENQKQVLTQNVGNGESGKLHFFDSVEGTTGGSLEGTTENLPEHKHIPTEKGLEYFLNTKVSAFRRASRLIIRHFHEQVAAHQGRGITLNTLQTAGYWIIGGRKMTASIIQSCTICRRLRAQVASQKMSDLPKDRVEPAPPFWHRAVD